MDMCVRVTTEFKDVGSPGAELLTLTWCEKLNYAPARTESS